MRNTIWITLALAAAYTLGTMQGARADDSGKLVDTLRSLIDLQHDQRDSLRTIARATESMARQSERCTK